ncbi:calcium/sodium antiporter [Pseudemcibacter aquimaris]|uniref:calcium/sodium antiporter n=1 Tax=Pseudemcibacter aquimaris TaxID=2857064 RepID=UPI0020139163|nr:calcium/sodium antiporter [Pseudemcibacter aquimaris]MCC3859729.1 calcium/sodium antiporter [Pseudemcibacter aquimaris]WDU60123.1 calcium/sodium antiporter [Pseudemcibacter aquimaris]
MEYIEVIAGLILLVICGDVLIRGSVSVAENFGVSKLVIGLTVIAFGTSAPELVVGVDAAMAGVPAMALGNVVGSNTANILLVIGVPAIMYPFICDSSEVRRNYNIMLAGSVIFIMLCFSAPLNKMHAVFLIIFLLAFLISSYKSGKVDPVEGKEISDKAYEDFEELPEKPLTTPRASIYVIAGLAGLMYGAHILVEGGVTIAESFGVSEAVIGLTIIAIGTSLPELVTAIMAARQNHGDVALGNIIGSNIFNLYAIMGATSLVADVPVPDSFLKIDLWVMLASSAALLPFILWKIRFNRVLGIIFTVGYITYLYTLGAA